MENWTYTTYLFHVDSSKWKRLSNTFPFPIHLPLSISYSVSLLDDSLNENERIIEGREREDEIYRRVRRWLMNSREEWFEVKGSGKIRDSRERASERATPPPSPVIIINRRRWYLAEYQSRNVGRLFVGVGGDNRNPRPRTDYVYDRCKRTRVNRYTGALWSIAKDIVYTVFICTGC